MCSNGQFMLCKVKTINVTVSARVAIIKSQSVFLRQMCRSTEETFLVLSITTFSYDINHLIAVALIHICDPQRFFVCLFFLLWFISHQLHFSFGFLFHFVVFIWFQNSTSHLYLENRLHHTQLFKYIPWQRFSEIEFELVVCTLWTLCLLLFLCTVTAHYICPHQLCLSAPFAVSTITDLICMGIKTVSDIQHLLIAVYIIAVKELKNFPSTMELPLFSNPTVCLFSYFLFFSWWHVEMAAADAAVRSLTPLSLCRSLNNWWKMYLSIYEWGGGCKGSSSSTCQ